MDALALSVLSFGLWLRRHVYYGEKEIPLRGRRRLPACRDNLRSGTPRVLKDRPTSILPPAL